MFEGLKTLVNQENLQKIKANQRYLSGEHSNNHSMDSSQGNSNDDDINDRIHVFNMLTNSRNQNEQRHYFHRDYEREQMRKLQKEINILQEKIRIDQELHERQMQSLKDQHRIEMQTLKLQIEKYEHTIRKSIKEEGLVTSLRKDIKRFADLHQQDQKALEKLTHQLASTKKQAFQLKIIIKKKEQAQTQQQAYRYIESSAQKRLKQEIANLQQEKSRQNQRKKQLQLLIQRLRSEKDDLEREIDASRHQFSHEVSIIEQKFKAQITRLEEDNRDLKKRSQTIEESFIDHLTQTSLNLQQNLKAMPERSFRNNSSLYLQASPIRARSKDHQAQDKDLSDDDPQKKDHQAGKLKNQVKKLRQKLEQANEKIVELLREKCAVQRKPQIK